MQFVPDLVPRFDWIPETESKSEDAEARLASAIEAKLEPSPT